MDFNIKELPSGTITTVFSTEMVFSIVYRITKNEELAIDASSWSEIASVGNTYVTDMFEIEVL